MTTTTLIVQPLHTGHRLRYVRDICNLGSASAFVAVLDESARDSAEYAEFLAALVASGRLQVHYVSVPWRPRHLPQALRSLIDGHGPIRDAIFLDTDACLLAVAVTARALARRGVACRAIVMRTPKPGIRPRGHARITIKKVLLTQAARQVAPRLDLRFLTDAFGVIRRRVGYRGLRPIAEPPDEFPLIGRESARGQLALEDSTPAIGVFGALGPSKHVDLVLEAMTDLNPRMAAIVAGPYDDWTEHVLDAYSARGLRIVAERGLLSADRVGALLSACDVVVVVSTVDVPSGFTVTAALARIPVVTAGAPWLRDIVTSLGIGRACELTSADVRRGLLAVLADPTPPPVVALAGDISFANWVNGRTA